MVLPLITAFHFVILARVLRPRPDNDTAVFHYHDRLLVECCTKTALLCYRPRQQPLSTSFRTLHHAVGHPSLVRSTRPVFDHVKELQCTERNSDTQPDETASKVRLKFMVLDTFVKKPKVTIRSPMCLSDRPL